MNIGLQRLFWNLHCETCGRVFQVQGLGEVYTSAQLDYLLLGVHGKHGVCEVPLLTFFPAQMHLSFGSQLPIIDVVPVEPPAVIGDNA